MRSLLLFSFPVMLVCLAILGAILINWSRGVPLCETWMGPFIPLCR